MSAVTMSGEANELRPSDTRGLTNGQIRIADNSPAKTETVAAAKRPAAIVNERLERLLLRRAAVTEERTVTDKADQPIRIDLAQTSSDRTTSLDNPSKSMLAQHVQSQIASRAEVAVLAQANQLPNDAMSYSSSE